MSLDLGELSGELGLDITPLESTLRNADSLLTGFASAGEATAKKAGSDIGAGVAAGVGDGVTEATRLLNELPKNAQGTVSETSKEFYALSPAMRAAVLDAKAEALQGLGQIPDGAKQIGKETASELGAGLDDATGEAEQAGRKAGSGFAGELKTQLTAGAKAAGAAAGLAISVGVVDNLNVDAGRRKLAGQLGLTNTDMAAAGRLAGQIYANNFGEDLDQVNDAVRVVIQNTNLDLRSVNTQPAVEKILNLANVFDQDLAMSAAAAGQLVRTGMAKDISEALDIITVGLQGPANKADDLLETFNEYGTQFRNVGIDGKTALGILSQAMQAGARDSDIAADAIKEFALRSQGAIEVLDSKGRAQLTPLGEAFNNLGLDGYKMQDQIAKGGPGAARALDTILDRLRKVKDPTEQARDATALFGTQAEDLGKALYAMDPSTAVEGIGKVGGAADRVSKVTGGGAQASIEGWRRKLIGAGRSAIEATGPTAALAGGVAAFGPAVASIAGPVANLILARTVQTAAAGTAAGAETAAATATSRGWIRSSAAAVVGGARVAGAWLLSSGAAVATAVASTATAVATTVAGWVLMGAQATLGALRVAAAWVLSSGAAMVTALAATAVAVGTVVGGWILMGAQALLGAARVAAAWLIALGPIGLVIAAVAGVVFLIIKYWDDIKHYTSVAWGAVVGFVKKVPGWILGFFMKWTLVGLIISHWNQVKSATIRVATAIVTWVAGLPAKIVGKLVGLGTSLYTTATGAFGSLKTGAAAKVKGLLTYVGDIPAAILNHIGDLSTLLYSAGKDVAKGMWNGIKDMAGWLKGKVWDWVKSVLPGPVKKALGIDSPSKVMRDIAKWVPAGLAAGIDDGAPMVDAAVARMAGRVTLNVRPPAIGTADTFGRRPGGAPGAGGGNTYNITEATSPTATAREIARIESLTGGA